MGGYMYVPLVPAMLNVYEKTHRTPIPAGKTWLKVPGPGRNTGRPALQLTQIAGTTTGLEQLNPQDLLALLQDSSQVSEQGPASGPGWTGTAYTFTASLTTSGPVQTETVGRTVRKTRVTFGDFGLAVSVSAPPASETFTPPAAILGPRPAPAGSG